MFVVKTIKPVDEAGAAEISLKKRGRAEEEKRAQPAEAAGTEKT